jgi:lysine 2,3-aminomutase
MSYISDNTTPYQRSVPLWDKLLGEFPRLAEAINVSEDLSGLHRRLSHWAKEVLRQNPHFNDLAGDPIPEHSWYPHLRWPDVAAVRILDYIRHAGREFPDPDRKGHKLRSEPFRILFHHFRDRDPSIPPAFLEDMLWLFRQLCGPASAGKPDEQTLRNWMERHPDGLDDDIIAIRKKNRDRILNVLLEEMEAGRMQSRNFLFPNGFNKEKKISLMREWWNDYRFHLRFALRSPELLNKALGNSLGVHTMELLLRARNEGIPTFVNPYYLSLLNIDDQVYTDQVIRDYVFPGKELLDQFGRITAWEKEDVVEPGKPNAAGWILPTRHNLHRRYPEVAILIPDTMGRACGGLCVLCQRMYDFQRGRLNFDLDGLLPDERWPLKLERLMDYFEKDTQLRDVLITGGDALMSSDRSLQKILDAVYSMALRKKEANTHRPQGSKFAEIQRVRLGTRLPVYLPQRITPTLLEILASFREKAAAIGISQFVIQTHVSSPLEITPEMKKAVGKLISVGWMVTNQHVFTVPASKRGHNARLRKTLNDIGVLPYYTFTVKGYAENAHHFVPLAHMVQESREEKRMGIVSGIREEKLLSRARDPWSLRSGIQELREANEQAFLATDRSVLNLPGVGKSLTFRTIGITRHGRRILEFDHDHSRKHSPVIREMGKVIIIESKSISAYLNQLREMGSDPREYRNVFGYSLGLTEARTSIFEYPDLPFTITSNISNLDIKSLRETQPGMAASP